MIYAPANSAQASSVWHRQATGIQRWRRESIRRLLPLGASSVWTGHSEPVSGEDVNEQLERAAEFELSRR